MRENKKKKLRKMFKMKEWTRFSDLILFILLFQKI